MKVKKGAVKVKRIFVLRGKRSCRVCEALFYHEYGWSITPCYFDMYSGSQEPRFYCNECGPQLRDGEYCIKRFCGNCPLKLTCLGRPLK